MGDFVFFRIFGVLGFSGSVAGPQDRNPGAGVSSTVLGVQTPRFAV